MPHADALLTTLETRLSKLSVNETQNARAGQMRTEARHWPKVTEIYYGRPVLIASINRYWNRRRHLLHDFGPRRYRESSRKYNQCSYGESLKVVGEEVAQTDILTVDLLRRIFSRPSSCFVEILSKWPKFGFVPFEQIAYYVLENLRARNCRMDGKFCPRLDGCFKGTFL